MIDSMYHDLIMSCVWCDDKHAHIYSYSLFVSRDPCAYPRAPKREPLCAHRCNVYAELGEAADIAT